MNQVSVNDNYSIVVVIGDRLLPICGGIEDCQLLAEFRWLPYRSCGGFDYCHFVRVSMISNEFRYLVFTILYEEVSVIKISGDRRVTICGGLEVHVTCVADPGSQMDKNQYPDPG
jgi:hypothetical protein